MLLCVPFKPLFRRLGIQHSISLDHVKGLGVRRAIPVDHGIPSDLDAHRIHYEGDTLVVDTVGIKVGRYAMVDWYGTPHTEALHVVERYRMLDPEAAKDGFARDAKQHNVAQGMRNPNGRGKYLQLQFTVE